MAISIEDIKRLRELTGVGMTDAKQALDAANGDFDAALKEMRQKGLTKAEKRGEKEARQGLVGTYNHDNRIGVIVELNCETDFVARNEIFQDLLKDIAMHVAAMNASFVSADDISAEERDAKKQELLASDALQSKPENMREQIVEGQLGKYFAELCLMDQPFIKNPDQTVGQLVKDHIARLGENIVVRRFSRIALGEVA